MLNKFLLSFALFTATLAWGEDRNPAGATPDVKSLQPFSPPEAGKTKDKLPETPGSRNGLPSSQEFVRDTDPKQQIQEIPIVDGQTTDLEGSIADTNVNRLLETKQILQPDFGFEDVFLTKESTVVLDTQTLGYPRNDLSIFVSDKSVLAPPYGRLDPGGSGGEEITVGKKEGSTQILYYAKTQGEQGSTKIGKLLKVYRITVTSQDLLQLLQEMKKLIGDIEGIEIRIVGAQVVVDGKILIPKDMRRLLAVVSDFKNKKQPVINLSEISPLSQKLLAEKMEEEIAGGKDRQRDIRVKIVNGRFFLEGAVDKRVDREAAVKICQAYIADQYTLSQGDKGGGVLLTAELPTEALPQCVLQVRVRQGQPKEPDPIISVRVDFVTLNRTYLKSFNFRWAPGLNLSGNTTYSSDAGKFVTSFVGILTNLFPVLDTAANHGYARVLKSATLLVRDGVGQANGGPPQATISEKLRVQTLVSVVNQQGNTVPSVTPTDVDTSIGIYAQSVPGSDKINIDIEALQTEISDISQQAGSPPSTLTNKVKTSLVISNGESAALGGLIVERRNVSIVRDPAQASGVNFSLFEFGRSHTFQDEKQQFIVFVTPEKLRNPSQGTETLKRKFRLRK